MAVQSEKFAQIHGVDEVPGRRAEPAEIVALQKETRDIKLSSLGAWLKLWRTYSCVPDKAIAEPEDAIRKVCDGFGIDSLSEFETYPHKLKQDRYVKVKEINALLRGYSMSELMVDHLRARKSNEYLVCQELRTFLPHYIQALDYSHLGRGARYFFPEVILHNKHRAKLLKSKSEPYPDAYPVHVRLPARGDETELHHHPGEEFLLCLGGAVKVSFDTIGLSAELGKNDYVHFHADQPHKVTNIGDEPAELFVVRSYLAATSPYRNLFRDATAFEFYLLRKEKPLVENLRRLYKFAVGGWVKENLRPWGVRRGPPSGVGTGIAAPMGLARQLTAMRVSPRGIFQKEKTFAKPEDYRGKHRYEQFRSGFLEGYATIDDLDHLAWLCELPPKLLYCYLFESVPQISVVKYSKDWKETLGREETHTQSGPQYLYPIHNLAGSVMTVARLHLPPKKASSLNRHFGSEMCIPICGQNIVVTVQATGQNRSGELKSKEPGYLHYRSDCNHCVENKGIEPAELLILRFFDTVRPKALPSFAHRKLPKGSQFLQS
jgi:mannose-6-phosphate isomerase-like protein (cupin superfamily)